MFRIIPHRHRVTEGILDEPVKDAARIHYPTEDKLEDVVDELFRLSSHYGKKYPVHTRDLWFSMDKVYWGRTGSELERKIKDAIKAFGKTKITPEQLVTKVKELSKPSDTGTV